MNTAEKNTFRLFVPPSFAEGVARIFDFHDLLQTYRYNKTDAEADSHALLSDWIAVGDDLREAIHMYEREQHTPIKR